MDIVGKQALEQMLADFPGTVLFVSHDRYFIKQVATHILDFTKDEVKQYNCTYDEYLIEKEKIAAGLIGNNGVSGNKSNSASNGGNNSGATSNSDSVNGPTLSDVFDKKTYYNPGKIKSRLVKQMEKYEKQIEESEEKIANLKMELMNPEYATNYPKLMELQNELDAEEHNQETLLERMLETEMELNELAEQGF